MYLHAVCSFMQEPVSSCSLEDGPIQIPNDLIWDRIDFVSIKKTSSRSSHTKLNCWHICRPNSIDSVHCHDIIHPSSSWGAKIRTLFHLAAVGPFTACTSLWGSPVFLPWLVRLTCSVSDDWKGSGKHMWLISIWHRFIKNGTASNYDKYLSLIFIYHSHTWKFCLHMAANVLFLI